MKKSKRYMAMVIMSQLSKKLVPATDWKFKALMRINETRLKDLYEKALNLMEANAELEVVWEVALSTLTPKDFQEIDAPGNW